MRETARVRVRAANTSASIDRPPGFGKGVKTLEKTFTTEGAILSPWSHTWLDPFIGKERQWRLSAYGNHYRQRTVEPQPPLGRKGDFVPPFSALAQHPELP